ncbi:MAG: YbgC/FadM family acyl-CoA thioesterase [Pseudomonadota bacterium]
MSVAGLTISGLGHFDGKVHILPVRVYYEDTDLSGVVYHANYLRYMERARTEFFRLAGVTKMADLDSDEPTAWAIRNVRASYLRPARVDDTLTVKTILTAISGARIEAVQKIYADDNLLMDGWIEACIITLTGRPRRLPKSLRDLLTPFLVETDT